MLFDIQSKYEIRKSALLTAVRFCGSEQALGALIEVDHSTISKWINIPDREIPCNKALLIEKHTGVSIELLIPDKTEENEYLRDRSDTSKLIFRQILKKEIITEGSLALPYPRPGRPVIIGTDLMLLSGSVELEGYAETSRIKVMVVDVDHLLWQILSRTIDPKQTNINPNFVHSERIAVSLRLEWLIGNRQGQRNDLKLNHRTTKINHNNDASLLPMWGEVTGRKDIKIANLMGYSTNTYYRLKQVYQCGLQELMNSADEGKIPIATAAEIANSPKSQQLEKLKKYLRLHLKKY